MSEQSAETDESSEYSFEENEIVKIQKVFINNIDSYQGEAICKAIQTNHTASSSSIIYEIFGSIEYEDISFKAKDCNIKDIFDRTDPFYLDEVTKCDIIIYDIGTRNNETLKEVRDVLKHLGNLCKNSTKEKDDFMKYFILISTPLTWVRTKPINDDNIFYEDHYRKRKAHPMYNEHQYIERITMNIQKQYKNNLKTIVICPGITFGGKNDVFHYIFKKAYFNQDIEVFHTGKQYIPMIYINDLARMIKQIIEDFPKPTYRYIFAIQPQFITAKSFARTITTHMIGHPFKVKILPKEYVFTTDSDMISDYIYDCITLNLKLMPKYFKDFEFSLNFEEFDDFASILANEFRNERNLLPFKIIIDGPPLIGKTTLATHLAQYYKINYFNINNILHDTLKMLENNVQNAEIFIENLQVEKSKIATDKNDAEEEKQQANEIDSEIIKLETQTQDKINEWKSEIDSIQKFLNNAEKSENTSQGNVNDDDDDDDDNQLDEFNLKKLCIFKILLSKPYNENHGYVMDGCPLSYQQLEEIFGKVISHHDDVDEENGDDEDNEGENEDNEGENEESEHGEDDGNENEARTNQNKIDEINMKFVPKPNYVIIIESTKDLILQRRKEIPEMEAVKNHYTELEVIKKLEDYYERNNEDTSLTYYFLDNDIIPFTIDVRDDTEIVSIFDKVKQEIGCPHIYPPTKFEKDNIVKAEEKEMLLKEAEEQRRKEEIAAAERQKKEANIQKWTELHERFREEEQEIMEAKTLPLRQYLSKYVLPTLTEGLLKVAQVKPEDPFDYLAEYLFECNPNGHALHPSYSDEKKKQLLSFEDDMEFMDGAKSQSEISNSEIDIEEQDLNEEILKMFYDRDKPTLRPTAVPLESSTSENSEKKSKKRKPKMKFN